MTRTKVFIDGSEGTTGLRIHERFAGREDIELLTIDPELRKDPAERASMIGISDITFLCLPDAAAREAVSLAESCENPGATASSEASTKQKVRIIDSSTAHRTAPGWAYGFPELSSAHRAAVESGDRVAVPGCHASGFIALARPLVAGGILPPDCPVSSFSLTGYSGGGKKMIAQYEAGGRSPELDAPREYGLSQKHKHLPEMRVISGLSFDPLFAPIVSDYYSGMVVTLPLFTRFLQKEYQTPEALRDYLADYYKSQPFITVMPFGAESEFGGFLSGNHMSGFDDMEIYVTGNEDRLLLSSCFDNLGKGASGAAVECFNLMTGCAPETGLNLRHRL